MNRIKWLLIAGALLGLLNSGDETRAEDPGLSLESLDQKVRVLERKLELDAEAAEEKKKTAAGAQAGQDGLAVKSADGSFQVKFRGYIQADSRFYFDDQGVPLTNTFLLRRVRPILEGTLFKDYDFNFTPDFAGSVLVLQDAYLDFHPSPAFRVRAGKFKTPVSLERLQSGTALLFVERSFPTSLAPNRDIGLQIHGDIGAGIFNYAVGVFNGVQDGASGDTDTNDSKDAVARIFTQPFKNAYSDWINGLSFGIAGSYGNRAGALSSYRTAGQAAFFTAFSTVTADGTQWRISPQLTYYKGRFGLLAEAIVSTQEVKRGAVQSWFSNAAWQAAGSFLITGDKASFRGVSPLNPFDFKKRKWGAWELTGRYSQFKIDEDAFKNQLALITTSAKRASEWSAGINWYLNKGVKTVVDYEETEFDGGGARNSDMEKERALFTRFQVAF